MTPLVLAVCTILSAIAAIVLGSDVPRHVATTQDLAYFSIGLVTAFGLAYCICIILEDR